MTQAIQVTCLECGKPAQVIGAKMWACPSCTLIQKVGDPMTQDKRQTERLWWRISKQDGQRDAVPESYVRERLEGHVVSVDRAIALGHGETVSFIYEVER